MRLTNGHNHKRFPIDADDEYTMPERLLREPMVQMLRENRALVRLMLVICFLSLFISCVAVVRVFSRG